jgi:dTDP-4-amino-4,6-dideoxygalactose transaminase
MIYSATSIFFIDLSLIHNPLTNALSEAFPGHIRRNDYIVGKSVQEYEETFAEHLGVQGVVGTSSGLDALRLAILAET